MNQNYDPTTNPYLQEIEQDMATNGVPFGYKDTPPPPKRKWTPTIIDEINDKSKEYPRLR